MWGTRSSSMGAGTPPLEGLRMILSEAATAEEGKIGEKVLVVADVKKAFYEAVAAREIMHGGPRGG